MMAARICRVPIRIHTFTGLVFPSTTGWKQQLLIATDKLTCACATYLNPEGKGVRRDLERFHITSRALHLIGNGNINGIDLAYFDRTPEVMRQAEIYRRNPVSLFASSDDWCGIKVSTNWFQLLSAYNRNLQTVVFA